MMEFLFICYVIRWFVFHIFHLFRDNNFRLFRLFVHYNNFLLGGRLTVGGPFLCRSSSFLRFDICYIALIWWNVICEAHIYFVRIVLTVLRIFVCVLMCFVKWSDRINFLVHSGHWKRFSPVWVLRCLWSSSDLVNFLPQNIQLQTNGRSPVCQRKWARKWLVLPYTLLQPAMWHICWRFLLISLFLQGNVD